VKARQQNEIIRHKYFITFHFGLSIFLHVSQGTIHYQSKYILNLRVTGLHVETTKFQKIKKKTFIA
jgi:hypothetical protein